MQINEKALGAARRRYAETARRSCVEAGLEAAIRTYFEAATPPDVAGLIERLEEGTNGTDITKTDPYLNALMRQAATALRLSAGGGWRTMDSAPKDGTRLLALQGSRHFDCWWHDAGYGEAYWQDECDSEPNPDRWQPLPASPTVEAGHVE